MSWKSKMYIFSELGVKSTDSFIELFWRAVGRPSAGSQTHPARATHLKRTDKLNGRSRNPPPETNLNS
jgi:hypothetical protein